MKFENLNILISGGSGGIGLAFAEQLLAMGNRVMICGRDRQRLLAAKQQFPDLLIQACDITNKKDIDLLLDSVDRRFFNLHVLINCAGIQNVIDFTHDNDNAKKIREEIEINLIAPMQLCQKLLPKMLERHSTIINITSALAIAPKQSTPAYCAAKAGFRNFTRVLRYQLLEKHIKVIDIVPALVETAMTQHNKAKNKMSPQQLVTRSIRAMAKGEETIYIEKARLLYFIFRLWPRLAYRLLQNA